MATDSRSCTQPPQSQLPIGPNTTSIYSQTGGVCWDRAALPEQTQKVVQTAASLTASHCRCCTKITSSYTKKSVRCDVGARPRRDRVGSADMSEAVKENMAAHPVGIISTILQRSSGHVCFKLCVYRIKLLTESLGRGQRNCGSAEGNVSASTLC